MAERYTIRTSVSGAGERFPLLVDFHTGIPLFDPTVFTLTEFRARIAAAITVAVNTLIESVDKMHQARDIECLKRNLCLPCHLFMRER